MDLLHIMFNLFLLELIYVLDKRTVFDIFLQRTSSKTKMTEKYVLGSGTRFPAWLSSGPILPNNLGSPVPSTSSPSNTSHRRCEATNQPPQARMGTNGGWRGRLSSNGLARQGRQEADQEQRETVITQLVANRTILGPGSPGQPSHSHCKYHQISHYC